MSEDVKQTEAILRLMFGDHYVSMFHVIDDDMIRKPVFQSQKIKSYENGDSVYKVTVNWRLLNKLRKDLKEQRLGLGLSQADIARRAGVSRQTIVKLEQKGIIPLTTILDAYEMDIVPSKTTRESIDVLREQIIDAVKDEFGDNCKVEVSVKLYGEEEE